MHRFNRLPVASTRAPAGRVPAVRTPAGRTRPGRARAARAAVSVALAAAAFVRPAESPAQVADTLTLEELRAATGIDSAYASPGLRDFVALAAEANRRLPELLDSYVAPVESELALLQSDADGRETVLQVEQVASDVLWRRGEPPVQRVTGYRSRSLGLTPSLLSMFEVPWVVPTLYGERIDLVRWSAPAVDEEGRVRRRRAVHPLGADRHRVYRFSGGDTVLTLQLPARTLRIVRIEVEPYRWPDRPTLLFDGWLDVDAERHQIVRMRGRMIAADPDPTLDERILGAAFTGATFVDFESQEVDGRFWLPRQQRIEIQAASRLTEARVAVRILSRFGFPDAGEAGALAGRWPDPPPGGVLVVDDDVRERDFGDWRTELGTLTAEGNVHDFGPPGPAGRATGGVRVRPGVRHLSRLVRYTGPEGLYTGAGLTVEPGRAWREGRVAAWAGWAWREETVRGGVEVSHQEEEARREWAVRAARELRSTSDFVLAWAGRPDVPPLVAGDDEAFFDRRSAGVLFRRPSARGWAWTVEAARAEDRIAGDPGVDLSDGEDPGGGEASPSARWTEEGSYWFGRAAVERNASAAGYGVAPGTALRLSVEGGTGELEWVRLEGGAASRRLAGRWSLEGRVDGGVVLSGAPPPQRLFELGRYGGLPGYPVRAFAGDRAFLTRGAVAFTLPLLERPLAVGGVYLPAPAPAPAVVVRTGWTGASEDARPVLETLGTPTSDGLRTTLELRLRLFGGGVSVGAARPLGEGGRWRFVWSLAGEL